MSNLHFMPNADPSRRDQHPSWAAYALYKLGSHTVRILNRAGLMGEATDKTLANKKETRRYGVLTIGTGALVAGGLTFVTLKSDGTETFRSEVEQCITTIPDDAPEQVQNQMVDDCEAMHVPDPSQFDTLP